MCDALLADLGERGLDFDQPMLAVVDGSKALRGPCEGTAVSAVWCNLVNSISAGTCAGILPTTVQPTGTASWPWPATSPIRLRSRKLWNESCGYSWRGTRVRLAAWKKGWTKRRPYTG